MSDDETRTVVTELIRLNYEGDYWDFKREWHKNKARLIHDIICMSNNPRQKKAYIIIGIDEGNDYSIRDVDDDPNRKSTSDLVNLLQSLQWAEHQPIVRIEPIRLDEGMIDVLVIEPNKEVVPYYLSREYRDGKSIVHAGSIYTRNSDVNTPIDGTAAPLETVNLWRDHFGLNIKPFERVVRLLRKPEDWISTIDTVQHSDDSMDAFYNGNCPEYIVTIDNDRLRDGIEYFMLVSPFTDKPKWAQIGIYYYQTRLAHLQAVYIDSQLIAFPLVSTALSRLSDVPSADYGYYYFGKY